MLTSSCGSIDLSRNGWHIDKPVTMGSGGNPPFPNQIWIRFAFQYSIDLYTVHMSMSQKWRVYAGIEKPVWCRSGSFVSHAFPVAFFPRTPWLFKAAPLLKCPLTWINRDKCPVLKGPIIYVLYTWTFNYVLWLSDLLCCAVKWKHWEKGICTQGNQG
jgi:hypothetical protein